LEGSGTDDGNDNGGNVDDGGVDADDESGHADDGDTGLRGAEEAGPDVGEAIAFAVRGPALDSLVSMAGPRLADGVSTAPFSRAAS
jgi:hypothetical protein